MSYLNFLKQHLPKDWDVREELDIDWDGVTTIAVLKTQTGNIFKDSVQTPIQLQVITSDVLGAKIELEKFIADQHDKLYIESFDTVVKQYYYTPVVPTVATPTGNVLTNSIFLTGTLLISPKVSDVTKLEIDGEEIFATDVALGYSTDAESHVEVFHQQNQLAQTFVKHSVLTLTFSCINKDNNFCSTLRDLRLGKQDANKDFNVILTYSDGGGFVEEYTMAVTSYALAPASGSLPVLKVVMAIKEVI